MERLTISERLDDSLKMLDSRSSFILYKTLKRFEKEYDDLSPSEIWKEAKDTLHAYISHPHPIEAIDLLEEAMHERYASFNIHGMVQQRSLEEANTTCCLVFNATLFLLNEIEDKDNSYTKHKEAITKLIGGHPLTVNFLNSIKEYAHLQLAEIKLPQTTPVILRPCQPPVQVTFDYMVKSIVCKAATRNGETIKSNAKGHAGTYPFYINADIFCKAMDEMMEKELDLMMEYLNGSPSNLYLNKVCAFIGRTISMCVINDESLQMSDMVFAFEELSTNEKTIKSSLSRTAKTYQFKQLMNTFEGYLRRHMLLS